MQFIYQTVNNQKKKKKKKTTKQHIVFVIILINFNSCQTLLNKNI
jgi:hypothetical protein